MSCIVHTIRQKSTEFTQSLYQVWKLVQNTQSCKLCKTTLTSAHMLYYLSTMRLQLQKRSGVQEEYTYKKYIVKEH